MDFGIRTVMENTYDEEKVIKQIINGNEDKFALIIDKYQRKITKLVSKFIYDENEADDVIQEIFIKVYTTLPKFKFKSSLGTYIYRIAVNYCIDYNKHNKKHKDKLRLFADYDRQIKDIPSKEKSPEQVWEDELLRNRLLHIIDGLSEKQKAVFILKYFDGLQIKEITEIMSLKEGTVKTHLNRAYGKIREELKEIL